MKKMDEMEKSLHKHISIIKVLKEIKTVHQFGVDKPSPLATKYLKMTTYDS